MQAIELSSFWKHVENNKTVIFFLIFFFFWQYILDFFGEGIVFCFTVKGEALNALFNKDYSVFLLRILLESPSKNSCVGWS